ncbi:acyl-CoA dehydratase activase [Clostridium cylindrosporum]|uniref:Activator of (R)-2-hydroxyglutaryl-CoA dehydratase HgdC n=1 Tax=Clostridium cylindrosporum DSM 605 TaxID=1121307 RepID=A0A0J8DEU7_CLOCY|nr:acyl-CoA dehydratase activase [Clostridium cylindrosporum]KMT22703.1 activator of (R)-2-hydroxyglutaryl-CoA dehydratase HgdC [Clostridium cylindrosporum DSM 605]
MYKVGIDIGSTSCKVIVLKNEEIIHKIIKPTGWSSVETANSVKDELEEMGINKDNAYFVSTGYGRVSVPFADKKITEITCHGVGAAHMFGEDGVVLDIGGQDTKVITIEGGKVQDFLMNDKCSAGTGRFLEVMANILGLDIIELSRLSIEGEGTFISSMCTVFAESEVISLIGSGARKEDIAFAVIDSIASKVKTICHKHNKVSKYFLTGGLCENVYFIKQLSKKLDAEVETSPLGRFAGALGAALLGKDK